MKSDDFTRVRFSKNEHKNLNVIIKIHYDLIKRTRVVCIYYIVVFFGRSTLRNRVEKKNIIKNNVT